jgi:hypothetical protein
MYDTLHHHLSVNGEEGDVKRTVGSEHVAEHNVGLAQSGHDQKLVWRAQRLDLFLHVWTHVAVVVVKKKRGGFSRG